MRKTFCDCCNKDMTDEPIEQQRLVMGFTQTVRHKDIEFAVILDVRPTGGKPGDVPKVDVCPNCRWQVITKLDPRPQKAELEHNTKLDPRTLGLPLGYHKHDKISILNLIYALDTAYDALDSLAHPDFTEKLKRMHQRLYKFDPRCTGYTPVENNSESH